MENYKNELEVLGKDNNLAVNKRPKGKGLINANTTINVNTADVNIKMDDNATKVAITGILGGILIYALKLLKK